MKVWKKGEQILLCGSVVLNSQVELSITPYTVSLTFSFLVLTLIPITKRTKRETKR